MRTPWVPLMPLGSTWRWRLLAALLVVSTSLLPGSRVDAAEPSEQGPPAEQEQLVSAALLTAAQARRATGFRARLSADLMAGEQGRSCYGKKAEWTCDGWFVSDENASPVPIGVAITVTGSAGDAQAALANLAHRATDRSGSRILESTTNSLVTYGTGLAVGPDLTPAVSVTVQRIQGTFMIMGSCQVEKRRLQLSALRRCAVRLQTAQARQAAGVSQA